MGVPCLRSKIVPNKQPMHQYIYGLVRGLVEVSPCNLDKLQDDS